MAIDKLIPDTEPEAFLESNPKVEIWDVAEHLWVTYEVVRFKMSLFRSMEDSTGSEKLGR